MSRSGEIQKRHRLFGGALALLALTSMAPAGQSPLPFDLGGSFALIDHTGAPRSEVDPDNKLQLVFFGYANCRQICSAALPLIGDIARAVAADGAAISPIMITVDPSRDTAQSIGAPLKLHHPDFIGLTGSEAALQVAYDAFSVEREEIFFDPEHGPVFAHGSFIYLLDAQGRFLALIPPILSANAAAEIVATYASAPHQPKTE